ncbi:MAG: glucose-6-phosphate dehydrogenase [Spirochaetes bacterium GWD1_61_31]|nr:MAG: glucose-6-phosphate dehydrogenase [Spirochaetes bacterium GWB1_60_80]OHD37119.1 MAG: glucose-6-phosphate dehydrogenase [Spirochaetes bacterium GWD1_61_31]OHD42665.1 MAG: glucose-6-phosphate dehydrogenase [Spirochaetes bacterium GWE1_60_18]
MNGGSHSHSTCITVLGGSGDLALRRILPAVYKLWTLGKLPASTRLVGLAIDELDTAAYRRLALAAIKAIHPGEDELAIRRFTRHLYYIQGDIRAAAPFAALRQRYFKHPATDGLFYLACAPDLFAEAARQLATSGLAGLNRAAGEGASRRVIVEKPFGTDLQAARGLNQFLHQHYREDDIFRIDHYLGKDAVQNLIYFRFANTIFEPLWNRKYIDRVEIVLAESGGIGKRGGYYDQAGAVRDMLQNHLMQLFCLTAMETPPSLAAADVREEKVKLLRAAWLPEHSADLPGFVRGQYRAGHDGQGGAVPDYRAERLVRPDSATETFVALKLYVDNWRWQGVPFILSTGKALERRYGEITIHFRQSPMEIPGVTPDANRLVLRIQPDEGVSMRFNTRAPGGGDSEHEELVGMLRDSASAAPGPYERLLADALRGDSTLFIRFDETEEAWQLLDPLLASWDSLSAAALQPYAAGSAGPDISGLYRHHPLWQQPRQQASSGA